MKIKKMMLALGLIAGAGMDIETNATSGVRSGASKVPGLFQLAADGLWYVFKNTIGDGFFGLGCGMLKQPIFMYPIAAFTALQIGNKAFLQTALNRAKDTFTESKLNLGEAYSFVWNANAGIQKHLFAVNEKDEFGNTLIEKYVENLLEIEDKSNLKSSLAAVKAQRNALTFWLCSGLTSGYFYGSDINGNVDTAIKSIKETSKKEDVKDLYDGFVCLVETHHKTWTFGVYKTVTTGFGALSNMDAYHGLVRLYKKLVEVEMILTHIQIQKTK